MIILGLDIGGANTKYILVEHKPNNTELLDTNSIYFPFWEKNTEYPIFLMKLKNDLEDKYGSIAKVVFVTTAELADCFSTKKEGIKAIFSYVDEVFDSQSPVILDTKGNFLSKKEAIAQWIDVAASNWFASASYLGMKYPNSIIIDIGSTTTDIIPIHDGIVVSDGRNDLERLRSGELVYSGLLRTNVISIIKSIKYRNTIVPVSSELFATTADVYLLLDAIQESEYYTPTADGKAPTKENAQKRLARIICADINQLDEKDLHSIAKQIRDKQLEILSKTFSNILDKYHTLYQIKPKIILIGSGAEPIGIPLVRSNGIYDEIIATEILDKEALNCFCAYATAMLYISKIEDG